MADQNAFGVTSDGFVLKGIDRIVADQQTRARQMFGDDVDLTSGSALRKVLDAEAWSGHELWKSLESQFYSNFAVTGQGSSLDLLGTDLGVDRRNLQAQGTVLLTLAGGAPLRTYVLPQGTVIETTAAPARRFQTALPVTLTMNAPTVSVGVQAMDRGPQSNIAASQSLQLNPVYAKFYLNLGPATVTPTNAVAFTGGELVEADADYRSRILGLPRTIWTVESLLAAVVGLEGVRDAAVFDPLGGVDVSQSYFNMFLFGQRAFSMERLLGTPYYFDVVVATLPGWPWLAAGAVPGVYDSVVKAVRVQRPVSIFPNILQANEVEIGVRATLTIQGGHDPDAIRSQIIVQLHDKVNALLLGRAVLYSDVMWIARATPGVVDVQNLHLRRCPPGFSGINFFGGQFGQAVEMGIGENIALQPDEVAFFRIDSQLIDIQVQGG